MDSYAGPGAGITNPEDTYIVRYAKDTDYYEPTVALSWDGDGYSPDTCWIEAPSPCWVDLEANR